MTKMEQFEINNICAIEFEKAMDEYSKIKSEITSKKLRSCTAEVFETENYYLLKSYRTIVAFINKNTDYLYDVLRGVYGYTATSAQHISKFEKDYCKGTWNCAKRFTVR